MKKTLFVLGTLVLLTSSFTFLAKEQSGGSDVCETYFPIKKGTQLTYENLDAKNKLTGTDYMTLSDLIEADGMTTMKIHAASKDEKGELLYESDFEAFCKNGVFTVSMESMMSAETMEAYKDMDVKITQTEVMYPNNMAVGMTLPDASMNLKISMDGMQIMSMDFKKLLKGILLTGLIGMLWIPQSMAQDDLLAMLEEDQSKEPIYTLATFKATIVYCWT